MTKRQSQVCSSNTSKKDFPHLSGLLATTVVVDGDTVQILNVDNYHWICIAVDRKNSDTVRVYDSMYTSLSLSSQQQICALQHPKNRHHNPVHVHAEADKQ